MILSCYFVTVPWKTANWNIQEQRSLINSAVSLVKRLAIFLNLYLLSFFKIYSLLDRGLGLPSVFFSNIYLSIIWIKDDLLLSGRISRPFTCAKSFRIKYFTTSCVLYVQLRAVIYFSSLHFCVVIIMCFLIYKVLDAEDIGYV